MAARRSNASKPRALRGASGKRGKWATLTDMRGTVHQAAGFLKSIGSSHRLMILCLLMDGTKTVTQLCDAIGARQSLISQHLTRLRLDGLVQSMRRGHFVHYSLTDTPARAIVGILRDHYRASSKPRAGRSPT